MRVRLSPALTAYVVGPLSVAVGTGVGVSVGIAVDVRVEVPVGVAVSVGDGMGASVAVAVGCVAEVPVKVGDGGATVISMVACGSGIINTWPTDSTFGLSMLFAAIKAAVDMPNFLAMRLRLSPATTV